MFCNNWGHKQLLLEKERNKILKMAKGLHYTKDNQGEPLHIENRYVNSSPHSENILERKFPTSEDCLIRGTVSHALYLDLISARWTFTRKSYAFFSQSAERTENCPPPCEGAGFRRRGRGIRHRGPDDHVGFSWYGSRKTNSSQ